VNAAKQKPADELRMSAKEFDRIMGQILQVKPKSKKTTKAKFKAAARKRRTAK
jgi:hypothetical protein